jgi:hypothetical protein
MKRTVFVILLAMSCAALAQPAVSPPAAPPSRGDLWQRLTAEQREQLWRSMTPEQKADLWRSFEPQERRALREQLAPQRSDEGGRAWGPQRHFERGDGPPRMMMMTPEERSQMREQIREANRLRRERMDVERRGRGRGRD